MTARPLGPINPDLAARIAGQVAEIKRNALTRAAAASVLQREYQSRYERMRKDMGR